MGNGWHQGIYQVINKNKYLGYNNPRFLSSWEKRAFYYFDFNKNVRCWAAELITIPYKFETLLIEGVQIGDGKNHKYITDIYCELFNRKGEIVKYIIEIKPKSQTSFPNPPKRKTQKSWRNYLSSVSMVQKNHCKWRAAKQYCQKRGYVFKILTEDTLF